MVVSIPCLSPNLFIEGLVDSAEASVSTVVTPSVAIVVTFSSLISMVTRALATVFSFDGGEFMSEEFKRDFLSFMPDNPRKNASLSLNLFNASTP